MAYLLPNGLILGAGLHLDVETNHHVSQRAPIFVGARCTLLARILVSVWVQSRSSVQELLSSRIVAAPPTTRVAER